MAYVDGFVIPLPKKNIAAYHKMAAPAGKVWMEYGALAYYETVGDDLNIEGVRSHLDAHACKEDETVVFAFIVFKSKADRNRVNKLVMADERISTGMDFSKMPFDIKRMCYGGFEPIVALEAKSAKAESAKGPGDKSAAKKTTAKKTTGKKTTAKKTTTKKARKR